MCVLVILPRVCCIRVPPRIWQVLSTYTNTTVWILIKGLSVSWCCWACVSGKQRGVTESSTQHNLYHGSLFRGTVCMNPYTSVAQTTLYITSPERRLKCYRIWSVVWWLSLYRNSLCLSLRDVTLQCGCNGKTVLHFWYHEGDWWLSVLPPQKKPSGYIQFLKICIAVADYEM